MQATCAEVQCHSGAVVLGILFLIFALLLLIDRIKEAD